MNPYLHWSVLCLPDPRQLGDPRQAGRRAHVLGSSGNVSKAAACNPQPSHTHSEHVLGKVWLVLGRTRQGSHPHHLKQWPAPVFSRTAEERNASETSSSWYRWSKVVLCKILIWALCINPAGNEVKKHTLTSKYGQVYNIKTVEEN